MPMREQLDGDNVTRSETVEDALAGFGAELGLSIDDDASNETVDAPTALETAAVDYNPRVPDEIEDFLNEPDVLDDTSPLEIGEYADPEELARELARTQRLLEHERKQRITVSRRAWEAEAKKFFPLADASAIQSDSRRGFLRAAKDQHTRNLTVLKPQLDAIAAERRANAEANAARERETQANQWGTPVTSAGGPPPSTTKDERLQAARSRRDLRGGVRALIESGDI